MADQVVGHIEPRGTMPAAAEADVTTLAEAGQMGETLANVVFTIVAARAGEHWLVTEQERARLGAALAPLLKRLMDRFSGILLESVLAAMVLLDVVIPRLKVDAQLEAQRASVAGGAHGDPAKVPTPPPAPPPPPADQPAVAGAGYVPPDVAAATS